MATWNELGDTSWGQLEGFTWDDLERLTAEQIQRFSGELWPVLSDLKQAERDELEKGLLEGTLPPPLLASEDVHYSRAQSVALRIWTTLLPADRAESIAYVGVAIALLSLLHDIGTPDEHPPATVIIIQEIPEPQRPILPPDGSGTEGPIDS